MWSSRIRRSVQYDRRPPRLLKSSLSSEAFGGEGAQDDGVNRGVLRYYAVHFHASLYCLAKIFFYTHGYGIGIEWDTDPIAS